MTAIDRADVPRPVARRGGTLPAAADAGRGSAEQIALQVICLLVALTVLFPILWIFSSRSIRGTCRGRTADYPARRLARRVREVIAQADEQPDQLPRAGPQQLVHRHQRPRCVGVSIGVLAAYAFSRLRFRGREVLMIGVLAVLMLPAVATIAPLFVLAQQDPDRRLQPAASRCSVSAIAIISGQLPFAIWNLKGYLDTIPKELEEAAAVDGASREPDILLDHPAAGHARPGRHRLPRLHRRLDRVLLLWIFLTEPETIHAGDGAEQDGRASSRPDAVVGVRGVLDPVRAPAGPSCTSSSSDTSSAASPSAASRAERDHGVGRPRSVASGW